MSSFRLTSPECVIALQQLTRALETTQECIDKWFNSEDSVPIVHHNALPSNRKSIAFIQAVFKHNFSPSAIDDAIEAVEDLQFEVTKYREEAESAFQHLWYLYDVQRFRTIQGHESVDTLASVATRSSVRTLASISSRIAECSTHYAEDGGGLIDDSNDPIQWLYEQALRTDLHPPSISAQVLSDYEGEDATTPPVAPIAIPIVTDAQHHQPQRQDGIPPPRRRDGQPPASPKDAEIISGLDPITENAAKVNKRLLKRLTKPILELNKTVYAANWDFMLGHNVHGGKVRMPGLSHDQTIHQAVHELFEGGNSAMLREFQETSMLMNQAIAVGGVVTVDYALMRASGSTRYNESS